MQCKLAGSSESMDSAGMLVIFQRSVEQHNVSCVEFLGDGDSNSHNLLVEEIVYGDIEIAKLIFIEYFIIKKHNHSCQDIFSSQTFQTKVAKLKTHCSRSLFTFLMLQITTANNKYNFGNSRPRAVKSRTRSRTRSRI